MPDTQNIPLFLSRLKTRQLVLMVRLDEERSVLRAAEAANMTQPAASKLLGDLEETFGVKFFDRHARGVEPTVYGEIMVRHARNALAQIARAHDEILDLKSGMTGQVAIGTVMNPGTNLVPMAVKSLKERFPKVRVMIEMDYSKPLVEKLLAGTLDLAIARILDRSTADQLTFEPIANEPHCVIARAGHPLSKRNPLVAERNLTLQDLVEQPWILPPAGSILRSRLDSIFVRNGFGLPKNFVETMSLPVITNLLRRTDMLVALPPCVVQAYCELGALTVLPIDIGMQMDAFGIITRRGDKLSPGAQALLSAIRQTIADTSPFGGAEAPDAAALEG